VATEVGCCEIGALLIRDLQLSCPLVAVNGEYDADRAWVQPEVALYVAPNDRVRQELIAHGADPSLVRSWGVPLAAEFLSLPQRTIARASLCARYALDPQRPIVLVSGGSEGLGRPDRLLEQLLQMQSPPQILVLAGRNRRLRARCTAVAGRSIVTSVRVLGWTRDVWTLMAGADLLISKLGHTFDEAIAAGLPIVALEPPPGSERIQLRLVVEWGVGRAAIPGRDAASLVAELLASPITLAAMRAAAVARRKADAAGLIARWIANRDSEQPAKSAIVASAPRIDRAWLVAQGGDR
jgi:UDP-N-acetylglucosamine:LPS N-acetylglucosamine transferase